MIGLAMAYHLAHRHVRVLLLERGDLAHAASGSNAGRAQILEAQPGLNLELVKMGHARLRTLDEELDCKAGIEWRPMGNLVLIEKEEHWAEWTRRASWLASEGIAVEMVAPSQVRELEPEVTTTGFLGAAFGMEANVNPFKFCLAYARAARRKGATILLHTPVTGFRVGGGRILQVLSRDLAFSTATVVVAAGAWTAQVTSRAGAAVPVGFHRSEAMVTEPLPPILRNRVGLAGFYEAIHSRIRATTSGVVQTESGNLFVSASMEQTDRLVGHSTDWGLAGLAANTLRLFPRFRQARIIRGMAVPSAQSPDENPILGWSGCVENLFVAGRLHLNIPSVPVVSDLAAGMVLGEVVHPSLERYSPQRFLS
jgi:glycine/D-amino acid oxidase-like deaminating enzyme